MDGYVSRGFIHCLRVIYLASRETQNFTIYQRVFFFLLFLGRGEPPTRRIHNEVKYKSKHEKFKNVLVLLVKEIQYKEKQFGLLVS